METVQPVPADVAAELAEGLCHSDSGGRRGRPANLSGCGARGADLRRAGLPAPGYVLRVTEAEELWRRSPDVGGALVRTWLFCADYWAATQRGYHQHPTPTPSHLLMVW